MVDIEINNLTFSYPLAVQPAIRDLSHKILKGEFVTILGANGAGKSTLCYLLAGYGERFLMGKQDGEILLAGKKNTSFSRRELISDIGFLTQTPTNQLSEVKDTVYEELAYRMENLGIHQTEMHLRIDKIMQQLHISDLAERHPHTLSGGQLQKVVLAANLVIDPQLLILDEPFSRLDALSMEELLGLLKDINRKGITIVATENRIGNLSAAADKVCLLSEGMLLQAGSPQEVLSNISFSITGVEEMRLTRLARRLKPMKQSDETRNLPLTLSDAVRFFGCCHEN